MWRCASHIPMCHRKAKGQGPATCNLWCEKTITQFDFAKRIFIQQFELPFEQDKPVIRKALVEMTGDLHGSWVMELAGSLPSERVPHL